MTIIRIQRHYNALHLVDFNNKINTDLSNENLRCIPEKPLCFDEEGNRIFTFSITRVSQEKFADMRDQLGDIESYQKFMEWWMHRATFETNDNSTTMRILRTRFYSDIIISYHVKCINNVTKDEKGMFKAVFDRFVQAYRYSSGDYRPRLFADFAEPIWVDFCMAPIRDSEASNSIEEQLRSERDMLDGIQSVDFTVPYDDQPFPKKDAAETTLQLENVLTDEGLISDYEFLGSAKHAVLHLKNYAYGVLESFIAMERIITELLMIWKINSGLSKNKIKDFAKEIPISYMINVEIAMMKPNLTQAEKEILGRVDRVRKMRNDLVHNSRRPSEKEALCNRNGGRFFQNCPSMVQGNALRKEVALWNWSLVKLTLKGRSPFYSFAHARCTTCPIWFGGEIVKIPEV